MFWFYISAICRDIFPMHSLRTEVSFYRPWLGYQSLSFPPFFFLIPQRGKTPFRMFLLLWDDLHLIENWALSGVSSLTCVSLPLLMSVDYVFTPIHHQEVQMSHLSPQTLAPRESPQVNDGQAKGRWAWVTIEAQSRFDAWDRALRAGALGWPWGMRWGGRWEGVQDGDTCTPMADSCQCMAKPPQYCKVISLQLK